MIYVPPLIAAFLFKSVRLSRAIIGLLAAFLRALTDALLIQFWQDEGPKSNRGPMVVVADF